MLTSLIAPSGIVCQAVDLREPAALREALLDTTQPPVKLVLCETPTNPMLYLVDLEQIVALAHGVGALVMVDNTWATPMLQRPLELGCDLVLHSTTKYLNGHSDAMGGALIVANPAHALWEKIAEIQVNAGAIPSPFDCWLILRGIATLAVRMNAHTSNADAIVQTLVGHAQVEEVHYPGLSSHPSHALASRQMRHPGAMVSFQVRGGEAAAAAVMARMRLFARATSLGGVHSLAEHRYKVEGPGTKTPKNLIRLSVGIEGSRELIADLVQALEGAE